MADDPFKSTVKEIGKEVMKEIESEKRKEREAKKEEREQEKEIKKLMSQNIYTTFFNDAEKKIIGEQVYDPKTKKSMFAVYDANTKQLSYTDHYGAFYYPLMNEAIEKGCVRLAIKPEEYGSLLELIDEIQKFIHKYLDVSENFEKFAVWYILLSWVYDKIDTIPYLRALGDTGTGKSRFLDVVGRLCYKPMFVAGAITPAPIFRLIEMFKGTLIVEEADMGGGKNQSDETQAIIKIFNCGFEKQKPVVRCNPNDVTELDYFDTYCPKILATRQRFQDQATESRCLTEIMLQTTRNDIPTNLLSQFHEAQEKLRNKLLWFRLSNYFDFRQQELALQDLNIEPRLKQAFEAFTSLFSAMPDVLKSFREFLVKYQKDLIEERADSFDGQIVNHLIELVDEGNTEITSKEIAGLMGEDIRPGTITKRLKVLGLNVKVIWSDNKAKRIIDWNIEQINKLRKRYITDITVLTPLTEGLPF